MIRLRSAALAVAVLACLPALGGCASRGLDADKISTTLKALDDFDKQCGKDTHVQIVAQWPMPPVFVFTLDKACNGGAPSPGALGPTLPLAAPPGL